MLMSTYKRTSGTDLLQPLHPFPKPVHTIKRFKDCQYQRVNTSQPGFSFLVSGGMWEGGVSCVGMGKGIREYSWLVVY